MLALRSSVRGTLLVAISLVIGCDTDMPLATDTEAALLTSASRSGSVAPSNLTSATDAPGRIDLAWRDNSDNEAGFEVQAAAGDPSRTFTPWMTTGPSVTSASFTGLGPSETYCFRVLAFTKRGKRSVYSEPSNTVCATTLAPPPPAGPNAPSNAVVTPISSDQVVLTWVDNADDEQWFRVEHSATSSGPWTFIGTLLGSGYTWYSAAGLPSER